MASRIETALEDGLFGLPEGSVVVLNARKPNDLSRLRKAHLSLVQTFKPDADALERAGYRVVQEPPETADLSIVVLPKSRAYARALVARAMRITTGQIVIDGQKTDGVESLLKELRSRADITSTISKAHGKLGVVAPGADLSDWEDPGPRPVADGFVVPLGVFSADRVDAGSQLLAAALPINLGARVADLGAGWGYLSRGILTRASVETCTLVEAEKRALDAARLNVTDARAEFVWTDATKFDPPEPYDTVVTNPPFHLHRASDPALGQAFIDAAARILVPKGQLFLVANRHLPYERHLAGCFAETAEIGGDRSFKLLRAARPRRTGARR